MDALKLFELQLCFYKSDIVAWKSLAKVVQEELATKYPHYFPVEVDYNSHINKIKNMFRRLYYKKVWALTNKVKHLVKDIDKRCYKQYELDHIVPISYGYKNNISPTLIASIDNLQMLKYKENREKSTILNEEAKILLDKWNV